MRRLTRACLGALVLLGASSLAVRAAPPSATAADQLDPSPNHVAFSYAWVGGFTAQGSFQVNIYDSGKVKLVHTAQSRAGLALRDPNNPLSSFTLRALLRLAHAVGFFSLPDLIQAQHPIADIPTQVVTVHSATRTKTVTLKWGASNQSFSELESVLMALTPRCLTSGAGQPVCYFG
jgi:hypothetical protein